MKLQVLNGYEIHQSDGWGKAVRGRKKTTSIQVRKYLPTGGYMLEQENTYPIGDTIKRTKAYNKCLEYIKKQPPCNT